MSAALGYDCLLPLPYNPVMKTDKYTTGLMLQNTSRLTEERRLLQSSSDFQRVERVTLQHRVEVTAVRVLTDTFDD